MEKKRKVILYISMSLDGFVATKDDGLEWLDIVERAEEDYGYSAFTATVDTYIVGRKSYQVVMDLIGTFDHVKSFDCYVLTRQDIPKQGHLTFYNGDVKELIANLKQKEGGNIYCDGGPQVVKMFMDEDLIDEYIISIIPTILGDGIRLFKGETPSRKLILKETKTFESGLVQVSYLRDRK